MTVTRGAPSALTFCWRRADDGSNTLDRRKPSVLIISQVLSFLTCLSPNYIGSVIENNRGTDTGRWWFLVLLPRKPCREDEALLLPGRGSLPSCRCPPALPQVSSCPATGLPLPGHGSTPCPAVGLPCLVAGVLLSSWGVSPRPTAGVPLPGRPTPRTGSRPHSCRAVLSLPLAQVLLVNEFFRSLPHPLLVTVPALTDCRLGSYYLSSLFLDVLRAAFSSFLMLDARFMHLRPFFFPKMSDWGGAIPFMSQFSCVLPVLKLHF